MPDSIRPVENGNDQSFVYSERARNSHLHSTEIVHALFGPSVGPCWGNFSCQYHRHRGRLYASSNAVLFYSQLFGFERKLCFYLQDIYHVEAYRSTSIRITTLDSEEHIFKSFYNREDVVQLLNQLKATGTVTPPTLVSAPAADEQEVLEELGEEEGEETTPPSTPAIEHTSTPVPSEGRQSLVSSLHEGGKMASMRSKSLTCLDQERLEDSICFPQTESESSSVVFSENLQEAWEEILKSSADFNETAVEGLNLSCDLNEYFDMFVADNAPFPMQSYQRNVIGDYELQSTPWTEDGDTQTRTISYRHPIGKTFGMGPSSVLTTSHQRLRRFGEYGTCIESSSTIDGIPSADCFTVEDQWILEPNGEKGITLSVRFDVRFTKRSLLKKMIQNSTRLETNAWHKGYAEMLQTSLLSKGRSRKEQTEILPLDKDMSSAPNAPWKLHRAMVGAIAAVAVGSLATVILLLVHVMQMHNLLALLMEEVRQVRSENTEMVALMREALGVVCQQPPTSDETL